MDENFFAGKLYCHTHVSWINMLLQKYSYYSSFTILSRKLDILQFVHDFVD